jgi:hypothetical protein
MLRYTQLRHAQFLCFYGIHLTLFLTMHVTLRMRSFNILILTSLLKGPPPLSFTRKFLYEENISSSDFCGCNPLSQPCFIGQVHTWYGMQCFICMEKKVRKETTCVFDIDDLISYP